MRVFKTLTLVMIVASATTILGAQQTKASTTPPKPASPATPAPAPAPAADSKDAKDAKDAKTPAEAYTYDPGGRRDPFLNLVGLSQDARAAKQKGEGGAAGMSSSEISVRGVMQSRGRLIAMVVGPDNKTYIVHQGDRLLDGSIKLITPQGLVIEQEVNDPLSVVKQREVRKLLRGLEDAK
jgi:type IV pilus assembly protein PilP